MHCNGPTLPASSKSPNRTCASTIRKSRALERVFGVASSLTLLLLHFHRLLYFPEFAHIIVHLSRILAQWKSLVSTNSMLQFCIRLQDKRLLTPSALQGFLIRKFLQELHSKNSQRCPLVKLKHLGTQIVWQETLEYLGEITLMTEHLLRHACLYYIFQNISV